jgi:8-amino-3,8-dideoxy-alpha-D-manno-octulosonate transaminase
MPLEDPAIAAKPPIRTKPLPLEFPGAHYFGQEEIEAVARVLSAKSPFRYYGIDLQREVESLELEFASFIGVRHAVAVGSGLGALSVALSAMGVGPGQQVIVPAYMWISVAAAVVNQGAIPVLADIDDTFCLDPRSLERRIGPRTTVILMTHMSGAPGDAQAVREIADRRGLLLLEDCAQCCGGRIQGRSVGTFGHMGIFSFQMNKNMTAGEGGCVVTHDSALYRRAVACHDLGYPKDDAGNSDYGNPAEFLWGKGTRLDEMRAAILRVQLRKLPDILARMHASKYRIRAALARFPGVQLRRVLDPAGDAGCFLITTYPTPEMARRVNRYMRDAGIVTAPQGCSNIVMTDWGMHLYYNMPSLVNKSSVAPGFPWGLAENQGLVPEYGKGACPAADSLFERSILMAIPSCLTREDEDDIIRGFEEALGREPDACA